MQQFQHESYSQAYEQTDVPVHQMQPHPLCNEMQQYGIQLPGMLPQEYYSPETRAHGQAIGNRLAMTAQMYQQGMPGTHKMCKEQLKQLGKNYESGVADAAQHVIDGIDTNQLYTQISQCNFSVTKQKELQKIIQKFEEPGGNKSRNIPPLFKEYKGRQSVFVGRIHKDLENIALMKVGATPQQLALLEAVEGQLNTLIAADPYTEAKFQYHNPKNPNSALKKMAPYLGILGAMFTAGMGLISGVIDVGNKRLSVPTVLYAGATGLLLNKDMLKGKLYQEAKQLSFLNNPGFEELQQKFQIGGKQWGNVLDMLSSSVGRRLYGDAKRGKIDKQAFIESIGAGSPDAMRSLAKMSAPEIKSLAQHVQGARNPAAREALRQYIEAGANPGSLQSLMS